jgi:hypothetical protein
MRRTEKILKFNAEVLVFDGHERDDVRSIYFLENGEDDDDISCPGKSCSSRRWPRETRTEIRQCCTACSCSLLAINPIMKSF